MARPIQLKPGGPFYLKERVPSGLVSRLKGQSVTLPVRSDFVRVRIGEHVQVSLRTKCKHEAKALHAVADGHLRRYWQAQEAGPSRLTAKASIALAGEFYRQLIAANDEDPGSSATWLDAETNALIARVSRYPHRTLTIGGPEKQQDERLTKLFGERVDDLLSQRGLVIDADSRTRLVRDVGKAFEQGARHLRSNAEGDYSPDPDANRFPPWVKPEAALPSTSSLTITKLAERWTAAKADKLAPNTIKRYAPSHHSFAKFVGNKDASTITGDEVYAWAMQRKTKEGIAARTVNQNDLVAVSSLFRWAMDRASGKLVSANPADKVTIEQEARPRTREKAFRHDEIVSILRAALAVEPDPVNPTAAFARRWCPWLAAYSGARITELTGLMGSHIRLEDGIAVMDFVKTKTKTPRTVPLHPHLIEQGFIEFAIAQGPGPLFYDLHRHDAGRKTPAAEQRSRKLAAWIREATGLDMAVKANHGWRHTWKTKALEVGIELGIRDAITGHVEGSVGRQYEFKSVKTMHKAMLMFPRYEIEG